MQSLSQRPVLKRPWESAPLDFAAIKAADRFQQGPMRVTACLSKQIAMTAPGRGDYLSGQVTI